MKESCLLKNNIVLKMKKMFYYQNNDFVVACIIGLLGSLCFITSLNGKFVYDDEEAIVNNKDLRPNSSLSLLLKHDFWGTNITHNSSHKSYRPLTVLSFKFNVWLNDGELDPLQFHILNLFLHFIATAMSYPLFGKLFNVQRLWGSKALFSSLLFAVHPVHTETVAGIVGRADLLCAILSFTSFFIYSKAIKNSSFVGTFWLTWLTILFAGFAMFCKEQGITIIGVCSAFDILIESKDHPFHIFTLRKGIIRDILIHILLKKVTSKKAFSWWNILLKQCRFALRHVILFIGGCVLIYFRCWIMDFSTPEFRKIDNPHSFIGDSITRVLNYNYIYALNAWLLICPEWLCFDWSMGCVPPLSVEEDQTDRRLIIPVIFWVVLSCLFLKCLLSAPDPFIRYIYVLRGAFDCRNKISQFSVGSEGMKKKNYLFTDVSIYLRSSSGLIL